MNDKKPVGGAASNLRTVSVNTILGAARFRSMTATEADRFAELFFDNNKMHALKFAALSTVVEPSREEFEKWLEDAPLIPMAVGSAIQQVSGIEAQVIEKK